MEKKSILGLILAAMTLGVFLWIQRSPESSQEMPGLDANETNSSKNSSAVKEITPIKDEKCCGCSSSPEDNTSTTHSQNNEETWTVEYEKYHNERYPQYKEGSAFIRKHVPYFHYRALNDPDKARLHAFAQYASHTLPIGQKHTMPNFCWATGGNPLNQSTFSLVRSAAMSLESQSLQGESAASSSTTDRWPSTATDGVVEGNNTITLTWSFVPDGTSIPTIWGEVIESDLIATLNSTYGAPTIANDYTTAPWFELFESAFNYWGNVTGNTYVYEPNDDGGPIDNLNSNPGVVGTRGDLRMSGSSIDGDSGPNNILAFNFFPGVGDMVIDTADSINFTNNEATKKLFRNMVAHEHGHGLGLNHVCPMNETKLMEPVLSVNYVGPQFDDVLSAVGIYGDHFEKSGSSQSNDPSSLAHDLGDLETSSAVNDVAISDGDDIDYFKFKVNRSRNATITVTPTDQEQYLRGGEVDGACGAGVNFNPATRQMLKVRLLSGEGSVLLSQVTASSIGSPAVISNISLASSSSGYLIEVTGDNANSESENNTQIYNVSISLSDTFDLSASNFTINSESKFPTNNAIDADEVINASLTLTNFGTTTIDSPAITLTEGLGLSILNGGPNSLPSLDAGESIIADFSFKQDGTSGSLESLVFNLSDGVNDSTFEHYYRLGTIGVIREQGFEGIIDLPLGWSQSTTSGDGWSISTASADSGAQSMFSSGGNQVAEQNEANINSAFLVSEAYDVVSPEATISFNHSYDFEVLEVFNSDGGIVEISIDGGQYQDIRDLGGTISGHTYTGTVSEGTQSPIEGQAAWVGNSGGFVTTIVHLPPSAEGKSVRLRWHYANDTFNFEETDGWYIDSVVFTDYTSAETSSEIQVSATDSTASEAPTSNAGQFTISTTTPVLEDTQVTYTLAGTATENVDYEISGSSLILSGQTSTTLNVIAIPDVIDDNEETVVITLTNGNGYSVGLLASSTVTITEPTIASYDDFNTTYFSGETLNVGEGDDFDSDGYSNLEEYAFSLNPTLKNYNVLSSFLSKNPATFSLTYTQNTSIIDLNIVFQTSTTLGDEDAWTTSGISVTNGSTNSEGKREVTGSVEALESRKFMRIKVNRIDPSER